MSLMNLTAEELAWLGQTDAYVRLGRASFMFYVADLGFPPRGYLFPMSP
jgi:hypothetical protein